MNDDILKEFDLLLMDYEEGSISDENLEKLRQLMKDHEELQKIYVRSQMISATLNQSSLSEISIADLERAEKAKAPAPKSFALHWLSFAAAALLAIAGVLIITGKPPKAGSVLATLEEHRESIKIIRAGKEISLESTVQILAGDIIRTTDQDVAFTYLNEATNIVIKENSELQIKENNGAKLLFLNEGDILCDVDKQPAGKPMTIITTQAKVTVVGTQFLLSSGEEVSEIHVSEGSVQFEEKDTRKIVETKAGWRAKTLSGKGVKTFPVNYDDSKIFIERLVLVDSLKEVPIRELTDGDVIELSKIDASLLNIFVDAKEEFVSGVLIKFDGKDKRGRNIRIVNQRPQNRNRTKETIFPYYVMGDGLGIENDSLRHEQPDRWEAVPGHYKLTLTPYGQNRKIKTLGEKYSISFTIKP